MLIIRTAEELAHAVNSQLQPIARQRLRLHAKRLAAYDDYTLDELAMFAVVQPNDTLYDIERELGLRLVCNEAFAITVETIQRHDDWIEAAFILSDDGFGLVVLVQDHPDTDPILRHAFLAAARERDGLKWQ